MRSHCPVCRLEVAPTDPPHLTLADCTEALAAAGLSMEGKVQELLKKKARSAVDPPVLGPSDTEGARRGKP